MPVRLSPGRPWKRYGTLQFIPTTVDETHGAPESLLPLAASSLQRLNSCVIRGVGRVYKSPFDLHEVFRGWKFEVVPIRRHFSGLKDES